MKFVLLRKHIKTTLIGLIVLPGFAGAQVIIDPDGVGNNTPVTSVVYEIGGIEYTQTTEGNPPFGSCAQNVNLLQINVTDGGSIVVADRVGGDITISQSLSSGDAGTVAVVQNNGQTAVGDTDFQTNLEAAFSSTDICDFLRLDGNVGGGDQGVTGDELIVSFAQPVYPDEYIIVQERDGNSTFSLIPIDAMGNDIGTNEVELQGTYDWDTGYIALDGNNQEQFFTVFRADQFFSSPNSGPAQPIYGFRVENAGNADVKFYAATGGKDFGDLAGYDDARHALPTEGTPNNLFIGPSSTNPPDRDPSGQQNATATADDDDGNNDDDGVASFDTESTDEGEYTVNVNVYNATGNAATLCGWFDYGGGTGGDVNGAFDSGERICVSTSDPECTGSAPNFTCALTWQVPEESRDNSGLLNFRFRVASAASDLATATGSAADGEVEDYQVNITTLPITLASVNSGQTESGLWVEWTTATETRNAGFHLYGRLQGDEEWQLLTEQLIPSKVIDSLDPQSYSASFPGVAVDELLLEDWNTQGQTDQHGPFSVGQLHGFDAVAHSQRIDWAAIHAANADDNAQRKTLQRTYSVSLAAATTGQADALLWVTEPGIQRLSFTQLQAAGADFSAVNIAELALTDNGKARPRHVIDANANGVFDSGDSVEFVGTIQDTLYSARNAYRLHSDPALVNAANNRTLGPKNAVPDSFPDTIEFEQQKAYSFAAPGDDPWYDQWLSAFGSPASLQRNFDLPGYAGGDATLTLRVWGVTDWPGEDDDHQLIVKVNGNPVADIAYDGTADLNRTMTLAEGQLQATGNTLTLEAPGDTGYAYDIQAFDSFTVDYQRHTQADQGAWQGTIPGEIKAKIQLSSFQGQSVAWKGRQRRVGNATLHIRGKGDWLAADARAIQTPTIQAEIPAPAAIPAQGTVDYLIISHAQFIDTPAMNDLVALQQGRGYTTEVVDVDTLYAAYHDFEVDAEAIRSYLNAAQPRFVLLVGADSYDYHDYLELASQSFIPTHYAQTDVLVTYAPTDSRHVDYTDDGIPQAPLGRLPVRTVQEFTQLVAKLSNYVPPTRTVLAAGPSDGNDEFAQVSVGYADRLPHSMAYQEFYADDLGLSGAKAALINELNLASALVSYIGHSSYRIWGLNPSHGILFRADDARKLTNATPHVVTQWGCWNTYFVNPKQDTMANGFLFQNQGAAAVLGATALTDLGLLRGLGDEFFNQVGQQPTLGDALRIAQQRYANANPGAIQALRGFALLGDPAAELQ